ncbi:hypothetical protein GCM10022293_16670 [Azospirillum formosense]
MQDGAKGSVRAPSGTGKEAPELDRSEGEQESQRGDGSHRDEADGDETLDRAPGRPIPLKRGQERLHDPSRTG